MTTLLKSKRNEVVRINLMQAQVEEKYFLYFILSIEIPLYQEGSHMDCQQNLNAQYSLKTQVR
jgi:hypothetical protein